MSNLSAQSQAAFKDTARIYDSGWPLGVSNEVKKAVCSFYFCQGDTLVFELMDVKRQQNGYDCGVLQ